MSYVAEHGPVATDADRAALAAFIRANEGRDTQTPPAVGPLDMPLSSTDDGQAVDRISAWLDERRDRPEPFFLGLGVSRPHVPFWAPKPFFDLHPLDAMPVEDPHWAGWADRPEVAMGGRFRDFGFEQGVHRPDLARRWMRGYHACVSALDANLGRLFDRMRRDGDWENTIIILTGDHGYQLGENGMWGKATLFEAAAKVPLIVRVPGLADRGALSDALVELTDLFPTLCDLCGVPEPHAMQGESLRPVLEDPSATLRDAAYTIFRHGGRPDRTGRSIRTDRHRYTEWGGPDQRELYDLEHDPDQHHNLADRPGHRATAARLSERLAAAREEAASAALASPRKP